MLPLYYNMYVFVSDRYDYFDKSNVKSTCKYEYYVCVILGKSTWYCSKACNNTSCYALDLHNIIGCMLVGGFGE